MPIKPSKQLYVYPRPAPIAPATPVNENKILRQFATKPVVKPLGPPAIKKIVKPLKSYL